MLIPDPVDVSCGIVTVYVKVYVLTFDKSVVWMSKTDETVFNATNEEASGIDEVVIVAANAHPTGNYCTVYAFDYSRPYDTS